MADDTVERLAVLIEANTKQYASAMAKLEKDTQRAINNSTKAVTSLSKSLGGIGGTATKVAGLLGVSLGVRAFTGFLKGAVESADAIGDLSQRLGITAEALQELGYAAKLSGADQDALVAAFRGMTKIMGDAAEGSKTAKAEFVALGLSFEQLKGKAPDQVLEILLDTIGRIRDPLQRNAELMAVFGKSGADMAQLASRGAAGIEQLRQRARDLGLVLSNDLVQQMGDTNDKLDEVAERFRVAGASVAEKFLPVINALADAVQSEGFQSSLQTIATMIAGIVRALGEHPDITKLLIGVAGGAAVGGLPGAAFGVGAAGASILLGGGDDPSQRLQALIVQMGDVAAQISQARAFRQGLSGIQAQDVDKEIARLEERQAALEILANAANAASLAAHGASVTPAGPSIPNLVGAGGAAPGEVVPHHVDPEIQSQIDATRKKYDELTASLQRQFAALSQSDREQAIANAQAELGLHATNAQKEAIGQLEAKLYDAAKAMDEANQRAQFFGDAITESLSALIVHGESAKEVLSNLIAKLADAALQAALLGQGPLASIFGTQPAQSGGVGGLIGAVAGLFGGARAGGGDVSPGKAYLVGEKRPELFVPKVPGTIIPRVGGGNSFIYSPNINMPNADSAAVARLAAVIAADKRDFEQNVIATVNRASANRRLGR